MISTVGLKKQQENPLSVCRPRPFFYRRQDGYGSFHVQYRWSRNCGNRGAVMSSLVGRTVGKYKLIELLGRGGMAEVYKARHPTLGRDVTVKVLHRHLADGEGFLARFEREAKAVAGLRHPHIVQIFDYEATEDANYMVMEFVGGGTLQDRMTALAGKGRYLPVREALAILSQTAEALDYAHAHGVLHRDVKPSNILLDSAGSAFLTDFGIARILNDTKFTVTGVMVGTPAYMSPEQGSGEEPTAASDIYSLGIIAYEMLGGKVPFTSETTPLAVIHKHIHEPAPDLRALRPALPGAAEAAVMKALAKKPQDRFATAGEFVRAIQQALPDIAAAELDSARGDSRVSIRQQPTEIMEEPPARAQMITEVMDTAQPLPGKEAATPDAARPAGSAVPPGVDAPALQPSGTPGRPGVPTILPRILSWGKAHPLPAVGIGLTVVAVVIAAAFLLPYLAGAAKCSPYEACLNQALQQRAQGNLSGFVELMNAGLAQVPSDQHPLKAGMWCDKGDAERQLGRIPDARSSYATCKDWTNGDPAFEPVRVRADQGMAGLP
jgi:serine/threonine protein kinase